MGWGDYHSFNGGYSIVIDIFLRLRVFRTPFLRMESCKCRGDEELDIFELVFRVFCSKQGVIYVCGSGRKTQYLTYLDLPGLVRRVLCSFHNARGLLQWMTVVQGLHHSDVRQWFNSPILDTQRDELTDSPRTSFKGVLTAL